MLKVNDINVYYGAIHAIKGVSFEVRPGEVVTLIGANGAGKLSFWIGPWGRCPPTGLWSRGWPTCPRDGGSSCK